MLTSPQLIAHSPLPRQRLGDWMGKLRHGVASQVQDRLPKVQNSFARPAPIVGIADDVPWGWSCPRRWGPRRGPPPAEGMPQHRSPGCFTKCPCPWPAARERRGQPARYSRHWHASLSRHRWAAGSDPARLLMPELLSGSCAAPATRLCQACAAGWGAAVRLFPGRGVAHNTQHT